MYLEKSKLQTNDREYLAMVNMYRGSAGHVYSLSRYGRPPQHISGILQPYGF
jgi:hypothetical protein